MLNIIVDAGADYEVMAFRMGKVRTDPSRLEIEVRCRDEEQLASLTGLLVNQGCYEKEVAEALVRPAPRGLLRAGRFLRHHQPPHPGLPGRRLAGRGGHAHGRGHRGGKGRAFPAGSSAT